MEEHLDFAVLLLLKDYYHQWTDPTKGQDLSPQSGQIQPGSQTYTNPQKWTDSTKCQDLSTKWTDLTRVTNLYKSTKWTDSTKGQDLSPQSGRAQPGSQTYTNPQSGRTPPRVKTIVRKVDRPNQGYKLSQNPQSGRTPPRVKINPQSSQTHQRSRP